MIAVINLPWLDAKLSPNARQHHMALHRARKKARAMAHQAALGAGLRPAGYPWAKLMVTWHPPTRIRRDLDNLIGRFKAIQDGIADALATDDATFKVEHVRGEVVKPAGAVIVTVELPI